MTYKYELVPKAQEDLDNIVSYIAKILINPKAALKLIDEYVKTFNNISKEPHLIQLDPINKLAKKNIRRVIIRKYRFFFYIQEETKIIKILRITHILSNDKKIEI